MRFSHVIHCWLPALVIGLCAPVAFGQPDDFLKDTSQPLKGQKPGGIEARIKEIVAKVEPAQAKPGQTVTWILTLRMTPGYHGYPSKQKDPKAESFTASFNFKDQAALVAVDEVRDFPKKPKTVKGPEGESIEEYEGEAIYKRPLIVRPQAKAGTVQIAVDFFTQICDDELPGKPASCVPLSKTLETTLTILEGSAVEVDPKYRAKLDQAINNPAAGNGPAPNVTAENSKVTDLGDDYAEILANLQKVDVKEASTDLWGFLLAGVFWGFISLITPCVFPMIPITVSFFLKQSERDNHRPVTMALVYSLTIIVTLTFAAVMLLSFFRWLSVNPIMNFALGALFVFFALSLFGMYEIELPSSFARFTSAREGQGGVVGTVFMALTFTIVSFACVAPFLGGFGGTAGSSSLTMGHRILGGLAFSITFASPFFVLALFPTLLKKMPKSGSWLNTVKVVMGFLELAAALKFFRAGELVLIPEPSLFTYDFVLGLWVALSLLVGLYLLNLYRLPHDTPIDHLGVPRLLFSFLFLGLAFYLMPAVFKFNADGENQRPGGVVYAWVDSFLLPEPRAGGEEAWTGSLKAALEKSRKEAKGGQRKFVFVDFTGETCTNCKINEKTVFPRPEIRDLLKKYNLVQLYTDKVPNKFYPSSIRQAFGSDTGRQRADAKANLEFQRKAFNTEQLPLYVILEPQESGKIAIVGVYDEGKINQVDAFAQFLQKPLSDAGASLAAR